MRTVLLNDTRGRGHLGCELTVRSILAQCRRAGLRIVATSPVTNLEDPCFVRSLLGDFDLLLINGEGSMHDDQPKALSLARAGELAAEAGKRVALVNSVWQNNRAVCRLLPRLDVIAFRESLSAEAAGRVDGRAEMVPDAVFSLDPPARTDAPASGNVIVTDSVIRSVTRRLAWLACRRRYAFAPLWRGAIAGVRGRRLLSLVMKLRCPPVLDPLDDEFLPTFAAAEAVITGRFHAACICLWMGVPVAAIASNTHKVQGLFRDAGCNAELVRPWPGHARRLAISQFEPQLADVRASLERTRRYVAAAKLKIDALFDRIAAL